MIDVRGFPTRILVVDDKAPVREALCSSIRLTSDSYLPSAASSGAEALQRLGREVFDVVLCDLRLRGELDGVDVTRAIRERHPHTRVVVFSGVETGKSKEKVLEAGAFSYLAKPINRAELLHAISTVNSIRRTERLHEGFEKLTQISWELQKDFDLERTVGAILDGVRQLGFARARLYLYDRQLETLVGQDAIGDHGALDFESFEIPFAASPLIRQIFQQDRPLFWNRQAIVERFGEDCTEPWMTQLDLHDVTWIDCPLLVHGRRIGTLSIDDHAPSAPSLVDSPPGLRGEARFSEEERRVLGLLAGFAAQALDNCRLYEKEALANASLRSIMREAPDAVITTDLDGTITFVSPSSERVLGYSADQMLRRRAATFYLGSEDLDQPAPLHGDEARASEANARADATDPEAPEPAPIDDPGRRVARGIMTTLRSGEPISNRRVQFRSPSGAPRPISLSVSLLRDEQNEAIGTLGILKDLGPLDTRSRQYRDLLEGFGYGTLLLDLDGRIVFVNRKAQKLLRRQRKQLLAHPFPDFVSRSQRYPLRARLARVGPEAPEQSLDLTLVLPEGRRLPVKAILTPGLDRAAGAVAVGLYDKSELGALIQSGRLMALGQMVAGVAHEINNPLNHVLLAASELADELAGASAAANATRPADLHRDQHRDQHGDEANDEHAVLDYVAMIQRNGLRIRDIVRQLRDLARPSDFERVPLSLNSMLESCLSFFETRLRNKNVELELDLAEDLPRVLADAQRLQQVVVNLIVNAEQAMEGQAGPKRIVVRTRTVGGRGTHRRRARIDVVDTGPGVPEAVRDSIFDPFFTTKAPNQGTGLGLSISKSIVDLHEGTISILDRECSTDEGSPGACFRVELPALPPPSTRVREPGEGSTGPDSRGANEP